MSIITTNQIETLFKSEFLPLVGKFQTFVLSFSEAASLKDDHAWKPGCYVLWSPTAGPVKVGRHLKNAKKRALEHLDADYQNDEKNRIIREMKQNPASRLLLFNVKQVEDKHWVAAVEIFLETRINPAIAALRLG